MEVPVSLDEITTAINTIWVLLTAFLVFFMQPGFAMLTAGLTRAKNVGNILMKNLMDFCMSSLGYWAVGFALMYGVGNFFLGGSFFFLQDIPEETSGVPTLAFWLFQLVFAGTAATIVAGAMAERTRFRAYLIYSLVLSAVIYPIVGHWVWGGGWLGELGFLDFAGSTVVHGVGGWAGLMGAIILGSRLGKYNDDGSPNAIPGHSLPLAMLGMFVLWFGWFGFNPGSTLSGMQSGLIAKVAVNTNLAAAAGGLAALTIAHWQTKKWDTGMLLNGILAGLVAVTAPAAWIEGWAAIVIGLIGGGVMYASVKFLEAKHVDDPVGAVSVHGVGGLWGLLSVGFFADGTYGNYSVEAPYVTGLLYGGGGEQLLAQLISMVVVVVWAFGMGYLTFKLMDKAFGIRVSPEEELQGLDIPEHGTPSYPDFVATR